MTSLDAALRKLAKVAGELDQLEQKRTDTMRRRDAALREAAAAGATYAVLERTAGISNVTVTKALRRT